MVLSYTSHLVEFHMKVHVKDAVITMPPYFGQVERRGLLQAAELAGIDVLSLVNEHAGGALHFSSGSTYAALVYFSVYKTREFGKTVLVNQFQLVGQVHVLDLFASALDQAAKIVKQVYSVIPVYDKIVPTILTDGVWNLPKACNFSSGDPVGPMVAKPTKGVSEIIDKFQDMEFTCEYKDDGAQLLEGLQSSLSISKIPFSHDKTHGSQSRSKF